MYVFIIKYKFVNNICIFVEIKIVCLPWLNTSPSRWWQLSRVSVFYREFIVQIFVFLMDVITMWWHLEVTFGIVGMWYGLRLAYIFNMYIIIEIDNLSHWTGSSGKTSMWITTNACISNLFWRLVYDK